MKRVIFSGLLVCTSIFSVQCMEKGPQCKDKETQAVECMDKGTQTELTEYFEEDLPLDLLVCIRNAKVIFLIGNSCVIRDSDNDTIHLSEDIQGRIKGHVEAMGRSEKLSPGAAKAAWLLAHKLGSRCHE